MIVTVHDLEVRKCRSSQTTFTSESDSMCGVRYLCFKNISSITALGKVVICFEMHEIRFPYLLSFCLSSVVVWRLYSQKRLFLK